MKVLGNVHYCACACGGHLATNKGRAGYAAAVTAHQVTEQHRAWADGPAFVYWQNGRIEGLNK